jgi:laccase
LCVGEWWNANVVDVEQEALNSGGAANISDAYTINGKPGDLYNCSENRMYIAPQLIEKKINWV